VSAITLIGSEKNFRAWNQLCLDMICHFDFYVGLREYFGGDECIYQEKSPSRGRMWMVAILLGKSVNFMDLSTHPFPNSNMDSPVLKINLEPVILQGIRQRK